MSEIAVESRPALNAPRKAAHAVQISRYGPPEVLKFCDVVLAPLAANDVRIRTQYAAVNRTDLQIRAGNWPIAKPDAFPYTPGVEVVGVIDEVGTAVHGVAPGQCVTTMMQGLGGVRAERPGGYAEFVTVDADAIATIPTGVDMVQIAALGLVGVTAYHGLSRIGPLEDKRILVTGAAGGIGSAATAIARALGASVTGLVTQIDQADYVRSLGADSVVVAPHGSPAPIPPESIDGVLDAVAGRFFGSYILGLRAGGVLSLVGAVAGGEVAFDAWQLIRPVTLTGYSTENLNGRTLREAVEALTGWLAAQTLHPPHHVLVPLAEAAKAHSLLEHGHVSGRILLVSEMV